MNTNYAALALVVDRSGSMGPIATDVRGSVKQFISDQKAKEGDARLTVVQFDHAYEVVHNFTNVKEVNEQKFADEYSPRGSTALLDAIGRTTIELSQRLDGMAEADRPKRVVVAIITDGLENASKEFNLAQVKEMIQSKEAAGWDFMFLGATLDAVQVAKTMGFCEQKAAAYDPSNIKDSFDVINRNCALAREGKAVVIDEAQRNALSRQEKSQEVVLSVQSSAVAAMPDQEALVVAVPVVQEEPSAVVAEPVEEKTEEDSVSQPVEAEVNAAPVQDALDAVTIQ